jgi:hypothetical protein
VSAINRYELWFKASSGTPWVLYAQTPPQRPRFRINVSVHLLDWQQARFHVKACNSTSCSQSNEVGVNGEQFAAMGYFKPSTSQPNQYFGMQFALSADGMTMAVISWARINHASAAMIHVYRRTSSSSGWHLDARLYPNPNPPFSGLSWGDAISLSGDGRTLVTANWGENDMTGAVYLFRRGDSGWRQTQRIAGQVARDQFGVYVKLDSAGKTLIIARNQDGGEHREGTLDVYQDLDDGSDAFVYATTVPTPVFDDPRYGWCRSPALSDAGHIVRACFTGGAIFTQVLTAISSAPLQYMETARLPAEGGDVVIDSKGERLLLLDYDSNRNWVSVYRREGSSWTIEAQLSPFNKPNGDSPFAGLPRISGDGKIIAIADSDNTLLGRGPLFPPYAYSPSSSAGNGTVAIYDLRPTGWRLRRYVKPDTDNVYRGFAWDVALNDNGHVMAVGSPYDSSPATGINGERDAPGNGWIGAIWLY